MKEPFLIFVVGGAIAILYAALASSINIDGCNESQCASDVSKCQLQDMCGCTLDNCSCCANCSRCLKHLWQPCCACVGLCKPPNTSHDLSLVSSIGNLMPIPTLFDTWMQGLSTTEEEDSVYHVYMIPHEEEDVNLYRPPSFVLDEEYPSEDCKVVFFDDCVSFAKCQSYCGSIGASRYRWFHTACCECIGHSCVSYGISESRCSRCKYP